MRVRRRIRIAYVHPSPTDVWACPSLLHGWSRMVWPNPSPGPSAATIASSSYGRLTVYDAVEDRWATAHLAPGSSTPGHHNPWGATDREMRFVLDHGGHGVGSRYFAGAPRIEFPPFSSELRFRVHGTASCLRLRTEPGTEGKSPPALVMAPACFSANRRSGRKAKGTTRGIRPLPCSSTRAGTCGSTSAPRTASKAGRARLPGTRLRREGGTSLASSDHHRSAR